MRLAGALIWLLVPVCLWFNADRLDNKFRCERAGRGSMAAEYIAGQIEHEADCLACHAWAIGFVIIGAVFWAADGIANSAGEQTPAASEPPDTASKTASPPAQPPTPPTPPTPSTPSNTSTAPGRSFRATAASGKQVIIRNAKNVQQAADAARAKLGEITKIEPEPE